jgi:hypothetical protein
MFILGITWSPFSWSLFRPLLNRFWLLLECEVGDCITFGELIPFGLGMLGHGIVAIIYILIFFSKRLLNTNPNPPKNFFFYLFGIEYV